MTRTITKIAGLHDDESPDPTIISTDHNVTDISPSSTEINRRVENQLGFSSPYFEQLYQRNPELPRSREEEETPNRAQNPT
jgi:hypothetical protein